ncbi:MAG: hypothetical protein JSS86_08300 [Cyanobacteria bacterium SZAS LIN-2]|nr:hypothetical protein [Cyanobacteria bacterium SZAS LIN-2]
MSNDRPALDSRDNAFAGNPEAKAATAVSEQTLHALLGEIRDLGEGIYFGGIEKPLDGAIQFINHTTGANLPEVHLVDANRLNQSVGGQAGQLIGAAGDVYALSLATGGLGGAGYLASASRMGAVGASYAGLFQPSDPQSKTFFGDRLANAAMAGAALAGMGAGAAALDATGAFAAPAARSLFGSMAYSGVSGAAGGAAYAEADALLKQGRAFPQLNELRSNVVGGAVFGAAMGGIAYGVGRLTAKAEKPATVNSGDAGADGSKLPAENTPGTESDPRLRPVYQEVKAEGPSLGGTLLQDGRSTEMLDHSTYVIRNGDKLTLRTTQYPIKINDTELPPKSKAEIKFGDKIESFSGWTESWFRWPWEESKPTTVGANVSIPTVSLVNENGRVITGAYKDIYTRGADAKVPSSSWFSRLMDRYIPRLPVFYDAGSAPGSIVDVKADNRGFQIDTSFDGVASPDSRFILNGEPATAVRGVIRVNPGDQLEVGDHKWIFQIGSRAGYVDGARNAARELARFRDYQPVVLPPTNTPDISNLPAAERPNHLNIPSLY